MTPDRLEAELRVLAANVSWPATPQLADRVVARIGAPAPASEASPALLARRLRPLGWSIALGHGPAVAAAVVVTLLVAGALVAPVRSAVLDVLGIAGRERVVRVPGPPDTSRPVLDVGGRTTLATAQRRLAFVIRLPRVLGAPREVRYSDAIAGGAVTLVYPGVALLETQGGTDPALEKRLGPGASAQRVDVAGASGFYLHGTHEIAVVDRDGRYIPTTRSLVRGDVLVWQRGGVALRLQTRLGLRRALAIGRSVR